MSELSRRASHSGSWYEDNGSTLSNQLDQWLQRAGPSTHGPARAIIAPHAGYSYSGACAAFAYKELDVRAKRVFILGPAHHFRLSGCALTACKTYQTPLYDLKVDEQINEKLYATKKFDTMSLKTDEDEHSIEMHLPYVAKMMEGRDFTIVPVLVGALSGEYEAMYGKIFSSYLLDPENVFVISSDFCHWGSRFSYQYHDKSWGSIHESITCLDKMGMDLIEEQDPAQFKSYLRQYSNTICGRHPIAVLLNAMKEAKKIQPEMSLKFLKYAQSNACKNIHDSSVSYASASLIFL